MTFDEWIIEESLNLPQAFRNLEQKDRMVIIKSIENAWNYRQKEIDRLIEAEHN